MSHLVEQFGKYLAQNHYAAELRSTSPEDVAALRENGFPEPVIAFYEREPAGAVDILGIRIHSARQLLHRNHQHYPGVIVGRYGLKVVATTIVGDAYVADTATGEIYILNHVVDKSAAESSVRAQLKPVARSFEEFILRLIGDGFVPYDYYQA